jgi:hypothetical protein
MAKVNPPPAIRIPQKINQDPELRAYFEQIGTILFQLWTRTGGGNDNISDTGIDAGVADNKATQALSLLTQYIQESGVDQAVSDAQIAEVIQSIGRLSQEVSLAGTNGEAKAFEALGAVDKLSQEVSLAGINGEAKAIEALGAVGTLRQDTSVTNAVLEAKLAQALDVIAKLSQTVELLAVAPPPREFKRARYGQFYDTTTQIPAAINTPYAITFNTTDVTKGVYLGSPASRVYVDTEGVYNFLFSIQLDKTSGGTGIFWVWPRINGVDVPDSNSQVQIQGNNAEQLVTVGYFFELSPGDYVEIMYAVNDVSVQVEAFPASGFYPSIPSIILTVSNNIQGVQ